MLWCRTLPATSAAGCLSRIHVRSMTRGQGLNLVQAGLRARGMGASNLYRSPRPLYSALSRPMRPFKHLAQPPNTSDATSKPPATAPQMPEKNVLETADVTKAEQRRSDWHIIKSLMGHVWPKNDWKTRGTVVLGFAFLITGKVRLILFHSTRNADWCLDYECPSPFDIQRRDRRSELGYCGYVHRMGRRWLADSWMCAIMLTRCVSLGIYSFSQMAQRGSVPLYSGSC